jgi:hypothetical protein
MDHSAGCHCSNIHVRLRLSKRPEDNRLRACTCSFCRSHSPRIVADPDGLFEVWADDWSLVENYRFGTRTCDFLICRRCGVFIAAVSEMTEGTRAVVNVNCLSDRERFTSVPAVHDFECETIERRAVRRTGCRRSFGAKRRLSAAYSTATPFVRRPELGVRIATHSSLPVFPQSVRLVRADRRVGGPHRSWWRGVSPSGSYAWHRLRCEVGCSAEFDGQSCDPDVRDGEPQRRSLCGGYRTAFAGGDRARDGGMVSAIYGVRLVRKLSGQGLVRLVALMLFGIGALLLCEAVFSFQYVPMLPASATVHMFAGVVIGVGIGLVSSLLGVAGGELLIPALMSEQRARQASCYRSASCLWAYGATGDRTPFRRAEASSGSPLR